jgi:Domain of unknown function (DUF397)
VRIFDSSDMQYRSGVDAGQNWRKSSRSMTNGNCVEVAGLSGEFVGVRDSVNPMGTVLGFTQGGWGTFVGGVRNGEFDRRR